MAVQRVIPDRAASPVTMRPQAAVRQRPAAAPRVQRSIAEQMELLADDYRRAVFCREQAENFRNQWFAGQDREIAYVRDRAYAGDPRFRSMTPAQLVVTGRWRWNGSADARYLSALENAFTGWAQLYLAFAQVDLLNQCGAPQP
jgi:hypothetical protein